MCVYTHINRHSPIVLNYSFDKITSPDIGLTHKPYKNTVSPLITLAQKKVSLKSYKFSFIGINAKRAHALTDKLL